MLPMQDPDVAVAVLDDALDLGLRGVCMLSSIEGRPIASDETLPVFRCLGEFRGPLVLHPAVRSQTREPDAPPRVAEGKTRPYHRSSCNTQAGCCSADQGWVRRAECRG